MGAFRKGLVIGFAAGYVQGSKAGRERYEQINRNWKRVKKTESYQRLSGKAGAIMGMGFERGKVIALDALGRTTPPRAKTTEGNGARSGP